MKHTNTLKLLPAVLLVSLLLSAFTIKLPQRSAYRKMQAKADELFINEEYEKAIPLYTQLYQMDTTNGSVAYRLGFSCLNVQGQKKNAEQYLRNAVNTASPKAREGRLKERRAPVGAYYAYAQSLQYNLHFDSASFYYTLYKTNYADSANKLEQRDLNLFLAQCRTGKQLVESPVNISVTNLGSNVNSQYPEYSPVLSADEKVLIFTTRRPGFNNTIDQRDGMYFEDIYMCEKNGDSWSEARPLAVLNTPGHEATMGISADGQQLFIYKDFNGDGNIYTSLLNGNEWAQPVKMSDNVNSKSWEPSASLSPDGNTLYFVSNREGGFGGRDIWRSVKLPNGDWSKPTNLGPEINSPFDEDAPSIQADGITLYYASNGPRSMGGFDILFSTWNEDNGWSEPVNIGYPVNSSDDDLFFIPTADNTHAYYSTATGPDGNGEKDICFLTFPDKEQTPLTVLTGEITSIFGGAAPGAIITVTDVETGELIGSYKPNSATGRYVIILPPGKNYAVTYEAEDFLFQSDNINIVDSMAYQQIERPVELAPLQVGQKIVVRNIFFDSGKSVLKPESKAELDKLVNLMKRYPQLIIEIDGHTDASGSDELNQRLSEQRAESVANYLVENGIERSRLRTKGFGEKTPIAINYNPNGSPNRPGMALNRRFEFVILSTDGKLKDLVQPIEVPENLKDKKKK
ncbi:MAG: OmpA family protein [Bacteroidetes bacterium]|nr:OmpA family protein [Bacteroidota bacterium]